MNILLIVFAAYTVVFAFVWHNKSSDEDRRSSR